jgi:hypothetical protein
MGHAAFTLGDPNGAVYKVAHLRRRARLMNESACDVLEHAGDIDFLLIMTADRRTCLLAGDSQHGHVIKPRVI